MDIITKQNIIINRFLRHIQLRKPLAMARRAISLIPQFRSSLTSSTLLAETVGMFASGYCLTRFTPFYQTSNSINSMNSI
jgi:hypothetical protein